MFAAFRLGGFGMYLTLLCGVPLVVASLRYAVNPEKRWVPLMLSLGVLTLAAGGVGFTTGLIVSLGVLERVPADERYITLIGLGESLYNVAFALMLVGMAAVATSIGTWRLSRASPRVLAQ
jgi:hypothetical protein